MGLSHQNVFFCGVVDVVDVVDVVAIDLSCWIIIYFVGHNYCVIRVNTLKNNCARSVKEGISRYSLSLC